MLSKIMVKTRETLSMQEIKCPHCGQAFTIDEAGYTAFVTDVCAKKSVGWAVSATMRTEGLPL
jgi:hypothetical protein